MQGETEKERERAQYAGCLRAGWGGNCGTLGKIILLRDFDCKFENFCTSSTETKVKERRLTQATIIGRQQGTQSRTFGIDPLCPTLDY